MTVLGVLALALVAVTMGLSLAHALEFPGKRRLDEATYRAVQTIYYPGFTMGGLVGELGGMVAVAVLLVLSPWGSAPFWWTAACLGLLVLVHAVYWMVTHPVNSAWLKYTELSGPGAAFFGVGAGVEADWTRMRDIWEWSHVARAALAFAAFLALIIAVVG